MAKSLVIVESPAKAKTINKYLGNGYIVKSSVGHIRDLPKIGGNKKKKGDKPKKTSFVDKLGVDPENGWKASYQIMSDKKDVVKDLKKLAENCDKVYLATDLDREGEAIAWHLKEVIGGSDDRFVRVVFNEITKKAITDAFDKPTKLDMDQVHAQQVRRFLDRIVGFTISPLLWEKVARGLSAGRVQSVATKVVVEREREIKAFIPEEFWNIFAITSTANSQLKLEATKYQSKALHMKNKEEADSILDILKTANYIVTSYEGKPTTVKPQAPFITSTLQQAASTKLGFAVKKTMMAAQKLYENGYITYMRTDSTFLSEDALNAVRGYIGKFGKAYLPEYPNKYGNKANAQEAHEAIRPSDVNKHPDSIDMESDAKRLYKLIWEQFVSCQMTNAQYTSTTILVDANGVELKAKGRVLVFDGFTKVRTIRSDDEDVILPQVKAGDRLNLVKLEPVQKYTKPPARYSEAALVKDLESKGIGRPSTYATIISTIQDRGYVTMENKRLFAEKTGELVTDKLSGSFTNLMDYTFTANLELSLDAIAHGKLDWISFLDSFWKDLQRQIEVAKSPNGMTKVVPLEVKEIHCKSCDRSMAIRTGTTGVFLGCTGYSLDPEHRCKTTMNLLPVDDAVGKNASDDEEIKKLLSKTRCEKCNSVMDDYIVDTSTKLSICSNAPECDGHIVTKGTFKLPTVSGGGDDIECDKCKGPMRHVIGRFGPYYKCLDEKCGNTRRINKDGTLAPPRAFSLPMPVLKVEGKKDHYVLRESGESIFLAASSFPKVKATRSIKIKELLTIKDKIPEKYHFYLTAPLKDPFDFDTVAMYDRFNKFPYVGSIDGNGKNNTWKLKYVNGKWVE